MIYKNIYGPIYDQLYDPVYDVSNYIQTKKFVSFLNKYLFGTQITSIQVLKKKKLKLLDQSEKNLFWVKTTLKKKGYIKIM